MSETLIGEATELVDTRIDQLLSESQLKCLQKALGQDFVAQLHKSSRHKVDIPYDTKVQFGEAIAATKSFNYLRELTDTKTPKAIIAAFRYTTPEEKTRDVIAFIHKLLTPKSESENSRLAVYLLDPQDWNGDLFSAHDAILINAAGSPKSIGEITGKRKIVVQLNTNRTNLECSVDQSTFTFRWLETQADGAMLLHELGHVNQKLDTTEAHKRLGIFNFPNMENSGIKITVTPQMAEDLKLIVTSELEAWNDAEISRKNWEKEDLLICTTQGFQGEKHRALSTYQKAFQPLFDRLLNIQPQFFLSPEKRG